MRLAKLVDGVVVTNDYNLNKVSQFHKIKVLNINELANSLKSVVIPGESLTVHTKGTERQQGVAYMDDGTMIVVEENIILIGPFSRIPQLFKPMQDEYSLPK